MTGQVAPDIAPECANCGQPMEPDEELGDDCWACDDCELGAEVNLRVLGRPVVVKYFEIDTPETSPRDRWRAAARQQALSRLAELYPAEFYALYEARKQALAAQYGVDDSS